MKLESTDEVLIFPIIVICLSVMAFIDNLSPLYWFSLIVSVMGIIGAVLVIKQRQCNHHLLELWLIAQIPHVSKTVFATASSGEYVLKIIDASQGFLVKLGLHFSDDTEQLYIGINILPLIAIGLLMYFKIPYKKQMGAIP